MLGIIYLILSLYVGLIITYKINFYINSKFERISISIILGVFISTWITFALSLLIGFNIYSIAISIFIFAVYIFFSTKRKNNNFKDFKKLSLNDLKSEWPLIILIIIIMPFFILGLREYNNGDLIFIGNYSDISYHLSMVSAFLEQNKFIPENPQSAGSELSYHFMINFHSAILKKSGFSLLLSVIIPQILFAFCLSSLLYVFYKNFLKKNAAVFFAISLLIMGHIGFFNILFMLFGHNPGNIPMNSLNNVKNIILFPYYNFLNPIINFFHPQRPFLFAFPLALIVLKLIYNNYKEQFEIKLFILLSIIIGLLPLFHIHSFLILFPIFMFTSLFQFHYSKNKKNRLYILTFIFLIIIISSIQVFFILSQKKPSGFSGFDVYKLGGGLKDFIIPGLPLSGRIIFWVRVCGFQLIFGLLGAIYFFGNISNNKFSSLINKEKRIVLLIFFIVPFFYFLLINFYRFSPNWGDSNKFFLYLELIIIIFLADLLYNFFIRNIFYKILIITVVLLASILPFSLEYFTIFSRRGSVLYTAGERNVAEWIKINTPRDAIFLTSDDVVHFVPSLSGRRVVNGSYTRETGFFTPEIDENIKNIYSVGAQNLIEKHKINYILVSQKEKDRFKINLEALKSYKMIYNQSSRDQEFIIFDTSLKAGNYKKTMMGDLSGPRYLSDYTPYRNKQEYGDLKFDLNLLNNPLILNNVKYNKGLGTHANSEIIYIVKKSFKYLESDIGLDDQQNNTSGSVIFEVYADDKLKFKSPVMKYDTWTIHIKIDIQNMYELKLIVTDGGDGNKCDHADWADVKVY